MLKSSKKENNYGYGCLQHKLVLLRMLRAKVLEGRNLGFMDRFYLRHLKSQWLGLIFLIKVISSDSSHGKVSLSFFLGACIGSWNTNSFLLTYFLDCLKESCMCAWVAILPLSVSLQSLLGSLVGGGVAAFSVGNVREPFPSSLETSSIGWFTQMSTWWNQIKYTLENDGPHCFSVSHPNNFIFASFNWLLSEWLCVCPRSHLLSGQHGSGFLRYTAKHLFKEDVDFFPQPGCGSRWNIYTSICIMCSHLGDFLDMRKHFYSSRYFPDTEITLKIHKKRTGQNTVVFSLLPLPRKPPRKEKQWCVPSGHLCIVCTQCFWSQCGSTLSLLLVCSSLSSTRDSNPVTSL